MWKDERGQSVGDHSERYQTLMPWATTEDPAEVMALLNVLGGTGE